MVCLPGDPGAALIGFEVLARPVIQLLAGAEPVFRPERAGAPAGDASPRRPGCASSGRRTSPSGAAAGTRCSRCAGGPYTLSGLAEANGLLVLGERVTTAAAGSTVDVLLLDRRR